MDFTSNAGTTATLPASAARAAAPAPGLASGPAPQCAGCPVRGMCLPSGMAEWEAPTLRGLLIGRRRVRKGQTVYREGDRFLFMYAVRFGTFKSSIALKDGGEQVTAFHLPGEIMGLDGTASGEHPTTVTALEDAEVCAVPYAQLTDGSADLRNLRQQVMRMVGTELVRDQRLLTLVARTHSEERVAAFLLHLSQRMQDRGYSSSDFLLRMTRADMGSYLGTTLETVSRCLSAFARRGFLKVRKRRIQLVNIEGLRTAFETRLP